jgi:radical SAM protein with 4Fe4S-binding SPASM domain
MLEHFIIPRKEIWGWKHPRGATLYSDNSVPGASHYELNKDGLTIVKVCNGKRTINEIVQMLRQEKTLTSEDIAKINAFINTLVNMKVLEYDAQPLGEEHYIPVVGESTMYKPINSTVELCDACNLRCNYCYRDAGPEHDTYLDDPIEFFAGLHEQGIRVLELSGGEPLMHPQILDILHFTVEKFVLVGLLSNGVLLTEEILNFIEQHNDKCLLQVSVPSLDRERFVKITGYDVWERLHRNLMLLKDRRILFRIGMVFHDAGALDEMRESALFAQSLGALQFVCAPFINLGRGEEIEISPETALAFVERFNQLKDELPPKFLGIVDQDIMSSSSEVHNCGAGSKGVVYDPHKRMRPCAMFPVDEFSTLALRDPGLRNLLAQVQKPRQDICGECQYFPYCSGCILRGWLKYQETQCEWGKSQNIDEIFAALRNPGGAAVECAHTEVTAVNRHGE